MAAPSSTVRRPNQRRRRRGPSSDPKGAKSSAASINDEETEVVPGIDVTDAHPRAGVASALALVLMILTSTMAPSG